MFKWWLYLRSIYLSFRVIAFDRFATTVAILLTFVAIFFISMAAVIDIYIAIFIGVALFFSYGLILKLALRHKHRLIKIGDEVEFTTHTDDNSLTQQFARGIVIDKLNQESVRQSKKFDDDFVDLYKNYFLIRSPKDVHITPSEQVVGIEIRETLDI